MAGANWRALTYGALQRAQRTVALISHAYLDSAVDSVAWQSVQATDPEGFMRKLIPVRVEDCERPGILGGLVSIDLFGRSADDARRHLLEQIRHAIEGRAKPDIPPTFPSHPPASAVPTFPGPAAPAPRFASAGAAGPSMVRQPEAPAGAAEPAGGTAQSQTGSAFSGGPLEAVGEPLTGHKRYVASLVFAPDGHILATGSNDSAVRLWDVRDPTRPMPFGEPLDGHTNNVIALRFAADGRTLFVGAADLSVRRWDVSDPAHPAQLDWSLAMAMA